MTKPNIYKLDFVIQSKPLTEKQEKELSEFIAKRKLEIKSYRKKAHTHNRVDGSASDS